MTAVSFYEYAEQQPDRIAVIDPDGTTTTYRELHERANQIAHALRAAGLGSGARIALLAENSVRYFEWALGAGQAGVQYVPVNTHLTTDETAYILTNSGAELVFADPPYVKRARACLPPTAHLVTDPDAFRRGRPTEPPMPRVHAQVLLYTSGTTGRPKGVTWAVSATVDPETALAAQDPLMARRGLRHDPGAVSLVTGPLYHGAPGAWGLYGLHHGHTVVLAGKWDSERFLRLVERYGVTTAQLAPIHFHRLLQLPAEIRERHDTRSLQVVSHAGAPTPVAVKRRMMEWWGPVLWEFYACSEGFGTSISPVEWLAHPGSVGRADGDGAQMTILDDDGNELPPGEPGTLWVRNPGGIGSEYLGDPEKTAAGRRGEFYSVGDIAYLDADGWLYLVDRRTDLILSGAVNIYPAEVENALRDHPDVEDVAVVGAPDPEWGERVRAVVVLRPGAAPDEDGLRRHAERTLARFKVPAEFEFRAALPYTPTGKLLRRVLKEERPG
ncbi:AMP-binding protein [Cryptosporangium sp. NPDC051539]|uniref:AMP-binding protein n=1 Tax=Cryptosporangium sp. NPDC051539 TaxID=3363962 RepID=UPI003788CEEB